MIRRPSWLARILLLAFVALAGLGPPSPASAGEWVQNFAPTELWSGPDASAISFGPAPQWDYFEVFSPGANGRLYVLAARTQNFAFIDAGVVGPSGPPPAGWPGQVPMADRPAGAVSAQGQASIISPPSLGINADRALWPALQILDSIKHTWTLDALAITGTRLEWGVMPPDAAGTFQPGRALVTFNARWSRADPRALAAIIEHEAKHVADLLAGIDVLSPEGCVTTEINAFREEAKTWGELVGPAGKPNPQDDLERSLNLKLAQLQQNPNGIRDLIVRNQGYRAQCRLR